MNKCSNCRFHEYIGYSAGETIIGCQKKNVVMSAGHMTMCAEYENIPLPIEIAAERYMSNEDSNSK